MQGGGEALASTLAPWLTFKETRWHAASASLLLWAAGKPKPGSPQKEEGEIVVIFTEKISMKEKVESPESD